MPVYFCCARYRRIRLRNAARASRLTVVSVSDRDSGVYTCRHRLDTDQLTIVVTTAAAQQSNNGNYSYLRREVRFSPVSFSNFNFNYQ